MKIAQREPPVAIVSPPPRQGAPDIVPPARSGTGGGAGGTTRVIARDEHDAWLIKVLRLLDEDGARCETKPYGSGWVSVCESVRDA